ncbi:MAG: TIGR00159 family protein [Bacteroidetes bacterium]|nr:TIGR00159 family protein [Bacteroidota bacterium]HET6243668.1 diadenylate cyclase CdaA [Bacteroidia bacterium]
MLINFFITLRWLDFLDILLVAFLIYQLYRLVKGTVAINIFIGILSFYMLWLLVRALNMQLLGSILGQFIGLGAITLIIVFQQELRRFLLMIGTTGFFNKGKFKKNLFEFNWGVKKPMLVDVNTVVKACSEMAETKTGALIIIATRSELKFFANTGDYIDAVVSKRLIESIFFKNNPMHDGAIIISGNRIKATRCVLPVTENPDFPHHLGMRHRAAVGITEASDAIAIIVSEQTGGLSFAKGGELSINLKSDKLKELLNKEFN